MNVGIGLECRGAWSIFSKAESSRSREDNKKTFNPQSENLSGTGAGILSFPKSNSSIQSDHVTGDGKETEQCVSNTFAEFLENLLTSGERKNRLSDSDVLFAAPSALTSTISAAGRFAVSTMTQSVHEACAALASFFGPDASQASRIVFSGLSLASAMARAVFPMVKEALNTVSDPGVKFVVTVISFSLSALHFLVSTVATAIATRNVPALFSTNSKAADFRSRRESIGNALHAALDKFAEKLAEINRKGLVGWLGVVREWLLTSAAVVGFVSVLPLLAKTVGTIISAPVAAIAGGSINLVASIVEIVQGYQEYRLLSEELEKLKIKESGMLTPAEKLQLESDIRAKTGALLASKIRIGKGVVGILTSVTSIVLGTLTLAAAIAVPYLPAVLTMISLLGVVVYASVAISLRKMREQDNLALKSARESVPDGIDPLTGNTSIAAGKIPNKPTESAGIATANAKFGTVSVSSPASSWQWRR
jgi:hypothetical protein